MSEPIAPLILYQFPPALGLPISESPPCAKVEVYLRLSNTPYELGLGDTRKSPTKMVPFVRWPGGELQAESGAIIQRLEKDVNLDGDVDSERLLRAQNFAKEAEKVLYDAVLYDRFVNPVGAKFQRKLTVTLLARFVPKVLAYIAAPFIDAKQVRKARAGIMANPQRGHAAAIGMLDTLVDILGEEPFIGGTRPSTVDCALWPLVVHAGATANATPLRDALAKYPTLCAWVLRFGEAAKCPVELRQIHAEGAV